MTSGPETVEELRALFATDAETPVETETVETPEEPEAEPVVEPEPEGEPEPKLLAGKYKDADALEAAYLEAQKELGRATTENDQLRRLQEEFQALRTDLQTPQRSYDPGSVDAFLAENPQQIPALAEQAIQNGDGYLYQKTLQAWGEIDQIGALDFHARKVAESQVAQLREEFQPALQGMQQQQTTNEMAAAYQTVSANHEDFTQVMNAVSQDTLNGFPPEVLQALQTGDQTSKERVLETLYRWTKAEQAGQLTQAATQASQATADEARLERQNAAVATQGGTLDREQVELSPVDAYRQQFRESAAFKRASGELKHR